MSENTDMVYMEKGEDGVAVVYLNQPKKKNAINATMMDLLTDCFHVADEDPEVRVSFFADQATALRAAAI